ncbi:MAG: hypothetical protein Q4A69_01740 [Moraxella sp.]|nr:hypothetical protein [Moraxella sp.]
MPTTETAIHKGYATHIKQGNIAVGQSEFSVDYGKKINKTWTR